jgi:16S rRNA U1498 N3-methylase RsmE
VSDRTTISPRATKEIEECRKHAAHCARQANDATSPEIREDFLRLEQNWLQLAGSYERAQDLVRGATDGNGDESAHRSRFV